MGTGAASGPAAVPDLNGAIAIVEQPRQAFVEQIMGLPISVHVRGPGARDAPVRRAVTEFYTALRADDAIFSTWKPGSQLSRIRRGELRLAEASSRIGVVADLCVEANRRTEGAFSAWLPGPDGKRGFDPTGLVKGWAVGLAFDRLRQRLAGLGAYDALVSAGGDVATFCARLDTPDWNIAIEDPRDRSRTVLTVPLRTGAVATSGIAARGEHIVDPSTGTASGRLRSATVIGPDLLWADVYATAAFVLGAGALDWVAGLADHAAVLVDRTGAVHLTPTR